ncbi:ArsC family transcriptional regulator [Candidatus Altiarchaeales archaeon WOR_SM1_SCG]|nr:ArsC family transcriptional regulator [Candidatus Altiarchaeales archaeon WOR_SM1_SCG]
MKKKVLFICIHNSARSQIAEGLLRSMYGNFYEVYSAGTQATKVNPYAVAVMKEIGIDISKQDSKSVNEFTGIKFDCIVTVCDNAKETCPFFPGGNEYIHKRFDDPSEFNGTGDEITGGFRRVRDEIRTWVQKTFRDF